MSVTLHGLPLIIQSTYLPTCMSLLDVFMYIIHYLFLSLLIIYCCLHKLWIVAVFTETNDYSVIPCNWLTEPIKENTSASYCKWPEYAVTSTHLKEAQTPMPNWDTYKIKILNNNKTYGKLLIFIFFFYFYYNY